MLCKRRLNEALVGSNRYDFEVTDGDDAAVQNGLSFSTRYSSALSLHERMVGTGLVALSRIKFPGKCRLSNMHENVENILSRGRELAEYYTNILGAAAEEPAARTWVEEELLRKPRLTGEVLHSAAATCLLLDGEVAFQCDDNVPLLLRCKGGNILEVTTSPPDAAVARISATQRLWEQCFKALLQSNPSRQPIDPGSTPQPLENERDTPALAALAAADQQRRPEITEARLRHGLLHTGLSVRVEYKAAHCKRVRLRWFRRKALNTPRVRLGRSEQDHQLAPMAFIDGALDRAEYTLSPLDVGCTIGCECIGVGESGYSGDSGDATGRNSDESLPTLAEQQRGSGKVGYAPSVLSMTSSCAYEHYEWLSLDRKQATSLTHATQHLDLTIGFGHSVHADLESIRINGAGLRNAGLVSRKSKDSTAAVQWDCVAVG
eukprot:COSAG02_NODE_7833_length_2830_cov_19.067941_2_plen_434_part_00